MCVFITVFGVTENGAVLQQDNTGGSGMVEDGTLQQSGHPSI